MRVKLHNAKWIGAEQIRQILNAVGIPITDSGDFDAGSPSALYALSGTWAELVAAHALSAFAANTRLRCTAGGGFDVISDGTNLFIESQQDRKTTLASASGVVTIDLHGGYSSYDLTLTENVTSWVCTNLPATGEVIEKKIMVIQHASAAKTVVSPATAGRTAGGIAWVADTTLSSRELLILRCFSDGTRTLFPTGRQV